MDSTPRKRKDKGGYSRTVQGRALYAARIRNDHTQQYVADYCGCSRSQIAEFERGRQGLPIRVLSDLAMWLQVPLPVFLSDADTALAREQVVLGRRLSRQLA